QLQAAEVGMEEQRKQNSNETLLHAQLRAQLEYAITLLHQAQTYTEANEMAARAALIKKARDDVLDKLARREPKTAISWQALAWVGRCHFEDDDPKKARKVYM